MLTLSCFLHQIVHAEKEEEEDIATRLSPLRTRILRIIASFNLGNLLPLGKRKKEEEIEERKKKRR
tara:strand:+ start:286 stop:483 length:198 start_codon:yes stop_codon:yes gene_type:complete